MSVLLEGPASVSAHFPLHDPYQPQYNKPIQDGGEAKAPLWLNRLSGTDELTDELTDERTNGGEPKRGFRL